jgi:hypothetical protein
MASFFGFRLIRYQIVFRSVVESTQLGISPSHTLILPSADSQEPMAIFGLSIRRVQQHTLTFRMEYDKLSVRILHHRSSITSEDSEKKDPETTSIATAHRSGKLRLRNAAPLRHQYCDERSFEHLYRVQHRNMDPDKWRRVFSRSSES